MGLFFEGTDAWPMRYAKVERTPRACGVGGCAIISLQIPGLGMEAANHPTSGTGRATDQRLEHPGACTQKGSRRYQSLPGSYD